MTTAANASPIPLELPIMYVAPHQSLIYVYAYAADGAALDRLQRAASDAAGVPRVSYAHYQPERGQFLAVLAVELASGEDPAPLTGKLSAVPGVQVVSHTSPEAGVAASEQHTLQVAGTPMVVLAREVRCSRSPTTVPSRRWSPPARGRATRCARSRSSRPRPELHAGEREG